MRKKKRIVIAMSGGVDSSVTAAMLKAQGHECIGVYLQFWNDPNAVQDLASLPRNKCCTLGGLEDARDAAAKLGIPFYVMNAVSEFKEQVVNYFLRTYAQGETPNPCVECNRNIKFGELFKRAKELKADLVASGHYAKVMKNKGSGQYELWMPKDRAKDQTYFLYHLSQEKLQHIFFPLGDFLKSEVYEMAGKFQLFRVAEKPQSQGLCFFSEATPAHFLRRYLLGHYFKPGPIVTMDGREIGQHQGLPLYTVGQRHGLGIGGIAGEPERAPWYVVKIDPKRNRLIIGREKDIYLESFFCSDLYAIAGLFPKEKISVQVRIRHRGELTPAKLQVKENQALITGYKPLRAISPGQAAVFYQGEKVLGGGIIQKVVYEKEDSSPSTRDLSVAY